MEKRRTLIGEWIFSHHPLFLLAIALGFIVLDPFEIGPMGGYDFRPVTNNLAPYKQVMNRWPRDNLSRLATGKLEHLGEVFGPESLEFDGQGNGPYTGLADGRIVRWMGNQIGWETFAIVTETWSAKRCMKGADSTTSKQWVHERTCGRPLGLRFDTKTGNLYIADAYHGLLMVGPEGGLATSLTNQVGKDPILFANDLDIHSNGSIFFTDTSKRHDRVDHFLILLEGESTGRLLRYDPSTKTTHVVVEGLAFPNGVQISKKEEFILFTETTNCRIMRYWMAGKRAGKLEVHADLPGFPDNVRVNERGEFWVAIDCCRTRAQEVLARNPWMRKVYFRVPMKMTWLARMMGMRMYTVVCRVDEKGEVLEVLEDVNGEVMKLVSEVREVKGKLWIGTVAHNHIATLDYP